MSHNKDAVYQTSLMAMLAEAPVDWAKEMEGKKRVASKRKKKRSILGCQLLLFKTTELTQTEKLIYLLWHSIKQRDAEGFINAVHSLSKWLSEEQFDVTIQECKRYLELSDKAWLMVTLSGHKLSPLSLLFPWHCEKRFLLEGNNAMATTVVVFWWMWHYFGDTNPWASN